MLEWSAAGKTLVLIGIMLALLGALMIFGGKYTGEGNWLGRLGKLPGDIVIQKDSFRFYFPLATSLLISVVISILAYLLSLVKW